MNWEEYIESDPNILVGKPTEPAEHYPKTHERGLMENPWVRELLSRVVS